MDSIFTQAIADLREKQERANEQHRIAMEKEHTNERLAMLERRHAEAMAEASSRLSALVNGYDSEMAEADRRLKSLRGP
jgi:hypothetical protein